MGLVDDFMQGISKEVSKVQARSQEMLQAYNVTQEIRELERQKSAKLTEIGHLIYNKYEHQTGSNTAAKEANVGQANVGQANGGRANVSEEELKEKAREIAILDRDIAQLQAELDSMKVQNDPNTSASKRADAQAGFRPTPGYECPNCHSPASREKAFCPTCGQSLRRPNNEDVIDVETK